MFIYEMLGFLNPLKIMSFSFADEPTGGSSEGDVTPPEGGEEAEPGEGTPPEGDTDGKPAATPDDKPVDPPAPASQEKAPVQEQGESNKDYIARIEALERRDKERDDEKQWNQFNSSYDKSLADSLKNHPKLNELLELPGKDEKGNDIKQFNEAEYVRKYVLNAFLDDEEAAEAEAAKTGKPAQNKLTLASMPEVIDEALGMLSRYRAKLLESMVGDGNPPQLTPRGDAHVSQDGKQTSLSGKQRVSTIAEDFKNRINNIPI